jgi:hypothetical protein
MSRIEYADGHKEWTLHGKRHRVDGPAIEHANGDKSWWLNDQLHRVDGPAIERTNGDKEWWLNDLLHRVNGPAVERADGYKDWWLNGKRHRVDGPAVEFGNGNKEWWLNGKVLPESEFTAIITRHVQVLQRFCRNLKLRRFVRLCRTPPTDANHITSMHAMFNRWDKKSVEQTFQSMGR